MMDVDKRFEIESRLVDYLMGRISLLQSGREKEQLVSEALTEVLSADAKNTFKAEKEILSGDEARAKFIKEFLSYGIIHDLLLDFEVEDIIINSLNPIYIHHSVRGLVSVNRCFSLPRDLNLFVKKLVLFSGRNKLSKIMNIELPNLEGRVNIVNSPFGPQLTITKAKMNPLSILDLIQRGSLTYEVAGQLWLYIEGMSIRPANIIIAGGPGVGKTTLLNALFSFLPITDRVVVLEDTLELNTAFSDSCSRLESGEEFSLADLVKNSLRMRPERIIVGEVRGEEARDMMTAVNIGKYCIGTIHALTPREAIIRLQNEPMNIPQELVRLIDVFVTLKRYHVGEKVFRVIDDISETSGMEQEKVLLSAIYKYDYKINTIQSVADSTVYRDRLAQHSAILPKDVIMEVKLRAFLLEQLAKKGMTTMKEVTQFCQAYNKDPNTAASSLGFDRNQLLGRNKLEAEKEKERRKIER